MTMRASYDQHSYGVGVRATFPNASLEAAEPKFVSDSSSKYRHQVPMPLSVPLPPPPKALYSKNFTEIMPSSVDYPGQYPTAGHGSLQYEYDHCRNYLPLPTMRAQALPGPHASYAYSSYYQQLPSMKYTGLQSQPEQKLVVEQEVPVYGLEASAYGMGNANNKEEKTLSIECVGPLVASREYQPSRKHSSMQPDDFDESDNSYIKEKNARKYKHRRIQNDSVHDKKKRERHHRRKNSDRSVKNVVAGESKNSDEPHEANADVGVSASSDFLSAVAHVSGTSTIKERTEQRWSVLELNILHCVVDTMVTTKKERKLLSRHDGVWNTALIHLPGRTRKQCWKKWHREFQKSFTSSRKHWSFDETRNLRDLVERLGTERWSEVAKALPGRTCTQCREKWEACFDPSRTNKAWMDDEIKLLFQEQLRLGNKWALIAKKLPGRTRLDVKNFWCSRRRLAESSKQMDSSEQIEGSAQASEQSGE